MLTSITVKHFKSYKSATLKLAPITVLIGANASGKSNLIEAIKLLSWIAQGQKLSMIQSAIQTGAHGVRGKLEDIIYQGGDTLTLGATTSAAQWNELSLCLHIRANALHVIEEHIKTSGEAYLYTATPAPPEARPSLEVHYHPPSAPDASARFTCADQSAVFTQISNTAALSVQDEEARGPLLQCTTALERQLSEIFFLDPSPAHMRAYSFPSESQLLSDGHNLSAVLFNLWGPDSEAHHEPHLSQRAALLGLIQSLPEQDISELSFLREPRGGVMVQLTETFGGRQQLRDASLLSDGTLRVLAIAAVMLSAQRGSLVVIEEIDNGVHPSRAQHLLSHLQKIAEERDLRVLISTHNPALLDALPDPAIPDVVFCYRHIEDGSSQLVRLADVPDYPDLIAQGSLGHLMTSGVLERFVKYHPTGEDRRQRALDWLKVMRGGL